MNIVEPSHEIMDEITPSLVMRKLELCGRTAYKSENKITPGSTNTFVKSIIAHGHESVLEHVNITIRFVCDRGVSHELVRHRLCAFTQESTRYVNYQKKGMQVIRPCFWEEGSCKFVHWKAAIETAEREYVCLVNLGCSPQEARSVLPNSLKTEIVVTANLREWRHILKLRTHSSAHPQIRELMLPLLDELKGLLPVIFGDIGNEK